MLSTDLELHELRAEWENLWALTPGATPFQSPEWLLPWWDEFGTGLPIVAVNRCNGRVIGVLPLYILPHEGKILPIGVGLSDYFDILGDPTGLLDAALASVAVDPVGNCDLVDIQSGSALIGTSIPNWRVEWLETTVCPVLDLPEIPQLARRKLRMNQNRARRSGGWTLTTATTDTLGFHLDGLSRLHQARWLARGQPGTMADPRVQGFWQKAAPGLLAAGLLRMQSINVADHLAAVIAALLAPNRIFFYLSGFDSTYSFVSPGSILLGEMLDQAAREGRSEAHFLRGGESYKYAWGARDRANWTGRFTRSVDFV